MAGRKLWFFRVESRVQRRGNLRSAVHLLLLSLSFVQTATTFAQTTTAFVQLPSSEGVSSRAFRSFSLRERNFPPARLELPAGLRRRRSGSFQHVFPWRASGGGFEVFAEEGGVGEVQHVAHLLHGVFPAFQQGFRFEYHEFPDPFPGVAAAGLADGDGEVFGREAHLAGIEGDAPFLRVVFLQQFHELLEQHFLPVSRFRFRSLLKVFVYPLVEDGCQHLHVAAQRFAGVLESRVLHPPPHQAVDGHDFFHFSRLHAEEGKFCDAVEHSDGIGCCAAFPETPFPCVGYQHDFAVAADFQAFADVSGEYRQHVVGLQEVFFQVQPDAYASLEAKQGHGEVDFERVAGVDELAGRFYVERGVEVVGQHELVFVHQAVADDGEHHEIEVLEC